jgi:CBS domain-containing protein
MQVRELLKTKTAPVTVKQGQNLQEAMRLLIDHKIGSLVVVNNTGDPVGIITERDIFRLAYYHKNNLKQLKITDCMTTDLVIGLPDDDLDYIAQIITQNRIRHIPILDHNKKLCGIISIGDIVKAQLELAEVHVRHLTDYIRGMPTNR